MNPLLALTLSFCLGIIFEKLAAISCFTLYGLLTVFFALAIHLNPKKNWFFPLMLLFMFFLGSLFLYSHKFLPKDHISNIVGRPDGQAYFLRGHVSTFVENRNGWSSFVLRVREIEKDGVAYGCQGDVLVYFKNSPDIGYGWDLALKGFLRRPFQKYLDNQGIAYVLRVKNEFDILSYGRAKGFWAQRVAAGLRAAIERKISEHLSGLAAGVSLAMVLGEKKGVPWYISEAMMRSGTIHVLVVSGFNVGIVWFILDLIFKLFRIPRFFRLLLAIPALILYCLATGSTNPVARATVMAVFFIIGIINKREPDIYNSLGLAAMCILLIDPGELFDIGFQLSFASVLAIVFIYPRLKLLLRAHLDKIKVINYLGNACLVSFSAWLGTAGLIAGYFGVFAPVTVLANLFIVPLASLITICAFGLVILAMISPGLAHLFAVALTFLVNLLAYINGILTGLPGAYFSI